MSLSVSPEPRARGLAVFTVTLTLTFGADARAQVRPPESFVVDRTDDAYVDACQGAIPNDCTLRGALGKALPGDIIIFDDNVFPPNLATPTTIAVTAPLPPITGGEITVWGTSSGRPRVILDGTNAGPGVDGLLVQSDGNFLRGLWIQNFDGAGIRVEGANNTIGGITQCGPSQANVLVLNRYGLHITGEAADSNTIPSGYFGTEYQNDFGGGQPVGRLGNEEAGVLVDEGADNNGIGAGCFGVRIAGNFGDGLVIRGAETAGNYFNDGNIGGYSTTDANDGNGVLLDGSTGFRVGHAVNIINNGGDGIRIEGATATGNNITHTYSSSQIADNGGLAINLVGGTEDDFGVTANDAGDADTGPNGLMNAPIIDTVTGAGGGQVQISGTACPSCQIRLYRAAVDPSGHGQMGGGLTQTSANAAGAWSVTATLGPGTWVTATATDASGNTSELALNVQGPLEIVVDRTDDDLVADCSAAPSDCTLRGALTLARAGDTITFSNEVFRDENNPGIIILEEALPPVEQGLLTIRASSGRPRVWIDGSAAGDVDGLVVTSDRNFIQGLRLMNFAGHGLVVEGADNTIGWPECGSSNGLWLSGNGGFGVVVRGEAADQNRFYYTLVGSDQGEASDGNTEGGMLVADGADNTNIGPGCYGPFIGGNGGSGLVVRGDGTTNTTINSSTVGRQGAGNAAHGILVEGGSSFRTGNVITIEHNGGDGIRIAGGLGHSIRPSYSSSRIADNGGLAINLVGPNDPANGVTLNDEGDLDAGANGLLNFPVIGSVESLGGGQVTISGTGCIGCSIALHQADPDPSGHGELGQYLGGASVQPNGTWTTTVALGTNTFVTALAYDQDQNTSEAAANVAGPRALVVDRTDDTVVTGCTDATANDCTLRGALTIAVAGDTIRFSPTVFPSQGANWWEPPPTTAVAVGSALPALTTGRVTLDGGTGSQPWVALDGTNAGPNVNGLEVRSDRNFVQGLVIRNFSGHGILVEGGTQNEIGRNRDQCGPIGGNTLIDNGGYGVVVQGEGTDNNNVRFNRIGFRADGTSGPNALGGILIADGAVQTGVGNGQCYGIEIHGNGGPGVTVRGADTLDTYLGELYVGRQANPNQGDGVWIDGASGVRTNTVMRIEYNTGAGVRISGATARNNRITPTYDSSSIRENGTIAIDLVGKDREDKVTLNDVGDADEGPNGLQNYPGVYSVRGVGDGNYTLRGTSCSGCSIGIFLAANDPSGHGEAQRYLGGAQADIFGIWQATVRVGAPTLDTVLTLNATTPTGDMSEFGANIILLEAVLDTAVCGNNIREPSEECEDGDLDSGDGCSAVCRVEFCGDGIVHGGLEELCDIRCDDGNPCTLGDTCASDCGSCVGGEQRDCDDGNGCTVDTCDPQLGCVHAPVNCDDGNACTVDACVAEVGCTNTLTPTDGDDATCDGADDNCDGATDEDFVGDAVTCGLGPCAATGTTTCVNGQISESCTPAPKIALTDSSCDGIDDDCDGTDDDDVPAVTITCGVGVCAGTEGVRQCVDGSIFEQCNPTAGASAEQCDGLDNNCDGMVDNAVSGSPTLSVCQPVETTITSGPSSVVASGNTSFVFAATHSVGLECSLDGAAWTRCDAGIATYQVANGSHTFLVRGIGPNGAVDQTPAYWSWVVDPSIPDTTIVSGPAAQSQSGDARFVITSSEADATLQCTLDGAPLDCAEVTEVTGLSDGPHTFTATSTAPTGTVDASPATWTWTVDTSLPETTLTSTPEALTSDTSASFGFSSSEPAASFECRVDGAAFVACETGVTYEELSEGNHVFEVRAVDAAGNTDPTPARHTWTIDLTGPVVAIAVGPADPSQSDTATFGFTSDEPATFFCAVDGASEAAVETWVACDPSTTVEGLVDGTHTLSVVGRDAAGNYGDIVVWDWTIDTTYPETAIVEGPDELAARDAGASFVFEDPTDHADGFECQLDGGGWVACDSGAAAYAAADLAFGLHRFEVRGCTLRRCDPTPAVWLWQVVDSACPMDTEAPSLTCMDGISVECTADMSLDASTIEATASDACGATTSITTMSGPDSLELGVNPVVVVATDGNGNTASCVVPVRVVDTVAPSLTCGAAVEVEVDGQSCDAAATLAAPTVTDACDGVGVLVVSDAPQRFALGKTDVTFTAQDRGGNRTSCGVEVTVVDRIAPAIVCGASVGPLVSDLTPRANDACGTTLEVEVLACIAMRDGVEVELGAGCPVQARDGRVVIGDDLVGAFDGDRLEVRYGVVAVDPSGNRSEELCVSELDPGALPISPSEISSFGGGGCNGAPQVGWWFTLLALAGIGRMRRSGRDR